MLALIPVLWACMRATPPSPAALETPVKVELTVPSRVASLDDLEIVATLHNPGPADARIRAVLLDLPSVVLEVRDAAMQPVPTGPPPVPPSLDGDDGQVLPAGGTWTRRYLGASLFGVMPEPGRYAIRFAFEDEWQGDMASPWVPFELD